MFLPTGSRKPEYDIPPSEEVVQAAGFDMEKRAVRNGCIDRFFKSVISETRKDADTIILDVTVPDIFGPNNGIMITHMKDYVGSMFGDQARVDEMASERGDTVVAHVTLTGNAAALYRERIDHAPHETIIDTGARAR